jgi:hypothetical protein
MVPGGLPPTVGMNLIKLHGSLSWRYAGPNSAPGDAIYETAGMIDCQSNAQGFASHLPETISADLEPMIVPPAAVKSPYYSNGVLQAYWKLAAKELSQAEELVIMGFSLPQTDLLVSSMLSTTLPEASSITPVDFGVRILDRVAETFDLESWQGARINSSFAGLGDDALRRWVAANTSI